MLLFYFRHEKNLAIQDVLCIWLEHEIYETAAEKLGEELPASCLKKPGGGPFFW